MGFGLASEFILFHVRSIRAHRIVCSASNPVSLPATNPLIWHLLLTAAARSRRPGVLLRWKNYSTNRTPSQQVFRVVECAGRKKTAMRQRKITLLVIFLSLLFFYIQQYTITPLVEKNHAAFALKPSKRSILRLAISNHSSLDSPVQRLNALKINF